MANTREKKEKAMSEGKASVLDEEIDKAMKSVTITKFRTDQLHEGWRQHLFKMAIGVVFLCMHQYSQPIRECTIDMKSIKTEIELEPLTIAKLLLSNGLVELVNLIIAILLCRYTSMKEAGDFSTRTYFTAAALVPFCLGLFFNTERCGCVVDSSGSIVQDENSIVERQFPVAIVYHVIVTGCYWFMKMGMDSCNTNLAAVTKLQQKLSSKNSSKKK